MSSAPNIGRLGWLGSDTLLSGRRDSRRTRRLFEACPTSNPGLQTQRKQSTNVCQTIWTPHVHIGVSFLFASNSIWDDTIARANQKSYISVHGRRIMHCFWGSIQSRSSDGSRLLLFSSKRLLAERAVLVVAKKALSGEFCMGIRGLWCARTGGCQPLVGQRASSFFDAQGSLRKFILRPIGRESFHSLSSSWCTILIRTELFQWMLSVQRDRRLDDKLRCSSRRNNIEDPLDFCRRGREREIGGSWWVSTFDLYAPFGSAHSSWRSLVFTGFVVSQSYAILRDRWHKLLVRYEIWFTFLVLFSFFAIPHTQRGHPRLTRGRKGKAATSTLFL